MPTPPGGRPAHRLPDSRMRRLAAVRASVIDAMERLFESKALWIVLFFGALTPLMSGTRMGPPPAIPPGSVAPDDIIAPATFEFVDDEATREVREAAGAAVGPVYDFDVRALGEAIGTVRKSFQEWRRVRDAAGERRGGAPPVTQADLIRRLGEVSELPASSDMLAYLASIDLDPGVEEHL